LADHVSYLKREGGQKDRNLGGMFDAQNDRADGKAFTYRCSEDRHHFRFTISPEDASEMEDIRAFTRDLTRQMQEDLGTKLDWVAIDHWNTDNPNVHLLVRGVDESGADLVMARDYISRGMRSRAEVSLPESLGPSPNKKSTPPWNERSPLIAGPVSIAGSNPSPMKLGCWT
jgi:type IV secretory pathway VirD2 relaxase